MRLRWKAGAGNYGGRARFPSRGTGPENDCMNPPVQNGMRANG